MPVVVRYVNPDSTTGGTGASSEITGTTRAYPSLSAWAAAEFPIGNNITHYVYCERGATTPRDTTAVDLSGVSIGNSSLVYILPNDIDYDPYSGADAYSYHYGVYDAGYVIYTTANSTTSLKLSSEKIVVRGIEAWNNPPTTHSGSGFQFDNTTAQTHRDLIARSSGGFYAPLYGFKAYGTTLENCIADNYGGGNSNTFGVYSTNYGNADYKNCLAANCYNGFQAQVTGGTDPSCINCVAFNCTVDYVDGGGGWDTTNSTNCATTDASAAESWVTVTSVSTSDGVDFTAPSTKDWTLTSGGALTDAGSATGTAVDIALEARS